MLVTLLRFFWRISLTLRAPQLSKLHRIIALAEQLIASSPPPQRGRPAKANGSPLKRATAKRLRRSGKELAQFRKMLKSERRKGVPVAELARRNGISTAYIYMLE